LVAVAMILGLPGCSAGSVFDRVPESLGGLPSDAPARPEGPAQYPAVHDMPPPRDTKPLSEEDQVKLEKDLQATRDRQAAEAADEPPADTPAGKPATPAKKPAGKGKTGQKTGVNTGAKTNP
jgi:hypothetical protein